MLNKEFQEIYKNIELMNYDNSTFNYFSICVPGHRDFLAEYLKNKEISTAIYYPTPLPSLEAHKIHQNADISY